MEGSRPEQVGTRLLLLQALEVLISDGALVVLITKTAGNVLGTFAEVMKNDCMMDGRKGLRTVCFWIASKSLARPLCCNICQCSVKGVCAESPEKAVWRPGDVRRVRVVLQGQEEVRCWFHCNVRFLQQ